MPIPISDLEKIVRDSFPDAEIEIRDLVGDSDHFYLKIVSKSFLGKTRLEQHKIVYKVLNGKDIHSLQLETSIS